MAPLGRVDLNGAEHRRTGRSPNDVPAQCGERGLWLRDQINRLELRDEVADSRRIISAYFLQRWLL